jgi:hypothetical protein
VSQIFSAPVVGQVLSGIEAKVSAPVVNLAAYAVGYAAPSVIPPPGAIIDAWNKGFLVPELARDMLRFNGVAQGMDNPRQWPEREWTAVIEASKPRLSPETVADLAHRGLLTPTDFVTHCGYAGLPDREQQSALWEATLPIDSAIAVQQYRLGSIGEEQASKLIQVGGYASDERYSWLFDVEAVESPTEIARWARRGMIDWSRAQAHLEAGQHLELSVQQALLNSDLEPPQTTQILQIAQRGCLGPRGPGIPELMVEYPFEWESWFHGLSTGDSFDAILPVAEASTEWTKARMDWAAHWRVLQPIEVARWRDISRAANAGWNPPVQLGNRQITDTDVENAAKQSALLPQYRPYEVAASYTHVGFRQLLQVAEFAELSSDQVLARTKLDGFSDDDSKLMSAALAERVRLYKAPYFHTEPIRERTTVVQQIVDLYRYGIASADDATRELTILGFREDEITAVLFYALSSTSNTPIHQSSTELKRLAWSAGATAAKAKIEQWRYGAITNGQLQDALALYGVSATESTWIMQAEVQQQLAVAAKEVYDFNHSKALQAQSTIFSSIDQSLTQGLIDGPNAIAARVNAGDNAQHATAVVSVTLAAVHARHVAAITGSIRKAYESGALSRPSASGQLARIGIVSTAIAEYLNTWDAEIGPSHHADTAQQILGHVGTGLVTPAQARARLTNLGWNGMDAAIELKRAEVALVKGQRAAARAATQTRAAAAKQLLQAARSLEQERKATLKAAQQYVSQSTLKTWFQQRIVSEDYVREYFAAIGFPEPVVNATIDSWRHPPKPVPPGTPSGLTISESIPGA